METQKLKSDTLKWRYSISGITQGVGFRPFIVRLARSIGLTGTVLNDVGGVSIHACGTFDKLTLFKEKILTDSPPLSRIWEINVTEEPSSSTAYDGFEILASQANGQIKIGITPDAASCNQCIADVMKSHDRRFQYAFTTCTDCGPRYSIARQLPFDRPNTTMQSFELCAFCGSEYGDEASRRFHAQTIACPECGPTALLKTGDGGQKIATEVAAIEQARELLRKGSLLAIKGVGGFHIVTDARNTAAVKRLRKVKNRHSKPFAIMARDLEVVAGLGPIKKSIAAILSGVERPIVLLERGPDDRIGENVAPNLAHIGVMLPLTPLHHLLFDSELDMIVATSANFSGDAIIFEEEAIFGMRSSVDNMPVVDYVLTHNRPIEIGIDDSVLRIIETQTNQLGEMTDFEHAERSTVFLRHSRGYSPRVFNTPSLKDVGDIIAFGTDQKNAPGFFRSGQLLLCPHVGDLDTLAAQQFHDSTCNHISGLVGISPTWAVHDKHPQFYSTQRALKGVFDARVAVQHHHAHMASCLVDNNKTELCIGIVLDGFGYGEDGQSWGGEILVGDLVGYCRAAHFRYVALPGGDKAARECNRMALSYLVDTFGKLDELSFLEAVQALTGLERQAYSKYLGPDRSSSTGLNMTSSAGRFLDAMASILAITQQSTFEGEAAMRFEAIAGLYNCDRPSYPFYLNLAVTPVEIDFRETIRAVVVDIQNNVPSRAIAARCIDTLCAALCDTAQYIAENGGPRIVALSGGVFANERILTTIYRELTARGLNVLRHISIPPGDGGIAMGQLAVAASCRSRGETQPYYYQSYYGNG